MDEVKLAYNEWSKQYDTMENKTRDLDQNALKELLGAFQFDKALEFGCGTGKNTAFLSERSKELVAADFSEGMLAVARQKIMKDHVSFVQADIKSKWPFHNNDFDFLSCNLVLEHVSSLDRVFSEAARVLKTKGLFYVSELHPFKQYAGSKARFIKDDETIVLPCFTHHVSDYFSASEKDFELVKLREWFDEGEQSLPRILTLLFRKK